MTIRSEKEIRENLKENQEVFNLSNLEASKGEKYQRGWIGHAKWVLNEGD